METFNWKAVLESLLFAAGDEGLSLKQIASVLETEESDAATFIERLQAEYRADETRGLVIVCLAGTYQLATKPELSGCLKELVETSGSAGLSQASLETLAITAYKQPITRAEIEEIRGVKTERPLQTLVSKGLIKEVGRAAGTGRARLYGTTREFLDYFGLQDLQELPPLPEQDDIEEEQAEADLFFERFEEVLDKEEQQE